MIADMLSSLKKEVANAATALEEFAGVPGYLLAGFPAEASSARHVLTEATSTK
tara:strand:+ start:955 stop:1113 length:159 start_codon:yes stop_codon:yes gene_type:complete